MHDLSITLIKNNFYSTLSLFLSFSLRCSLAFKERNLEFFNFEPHFPVNVSHIIFRTFPQIKSDLLLFLDFVLAIVCSGLP